MATTVTVVGTVVLSVVITVCTLLLLVTDEYIEMIVFDRK